jgi:short-subunit dehydrogenase
MKTALITGASLGIGKVFAEKLAGLGYALILVSRQEALLVALADELKERYGVTIFVVALDLAAPGQAKCLYEHIQALNLEVDTLILNAGVGYAKSFALSPLERIEQVLYLNIVSLTELTHFFLPSMKEKKSGLIIPVASVAAYLPGPGLATYYASKSYVLSFSRALHEELRSHGIQVSVVCPGPTKTNFFQNADMDKRLIERRSFAFMTAEAVVEKSWQAIQKGKTIVIPGWKNKLFVFLIRYTPLRLVLLALKRFS